MPSDPAAPTTDSAPDDAIEEVPPSSTLIQILESGALDEPSQRRAELFHGRWDGFVPATPDETAALALGRYRLSDPALLDAEADPMIRARAALLRGESDGVLRLLADNDAVPAVLLRARAHEQRGQLAEAVALLTPLRERFQHETINDAPTLTAAARSIVMLAHLEGRPSQDYRLALGMLSKVHQEIDPLYWPAHIAEAELLMTKDNRAEAGQALETALSLQPNSGEAWYTLGRLTVDGYDFETAAKVSRRLREINPIHPLADELDIRSFLRQRDVASARRVLEPALSTYPLRRELLALAAATAGMAYDTQELDAALDAFDAVAPGSPIALHTTGQFLSTDRQYVSAEDLLRRAIARSPGWSAPRLDLGLLLMQAGDLEAARVELAHAARLDPFHKRVNNQLRLVEDLVGLYETIETEHFIIRYKPGIDEVLARDMPGPLEEMYDEITAVFQHEPANKTQVDVMPNLSNFAVRITGMPDIWTIAAATGDVVAITPPAVRRRPGRPLQLGQRYAARIRPHGHARADRQPRPHWFTEACAVSSETVGRTYSTCQLLTWALHNDELFDYDQINWGFIRPKTPRDRPLAYAQADWMLEFIATEWSHGAIVELLELYGEGVSDTEALREVTGLSPDAFMERFRVWASGQVAAWGMDERETSEEASRALASGGEGVATADLIALLDEHGGGHPDLLKLITERAAESIDANEAKYWLSRYTEARPVDPWPHKQLVKLAFDLDRPDDALGSLQLLEQSDNYTATWSRQLAELHRRAGRLDAAQRAMTRALHFEPYNAAFRELAATIALQRRDLEAAAFQVESLAILEPDRAAHPTRLAVIYQRLGRADDAVDAATRARELDENANVGAVLGE